MTKKFRETESNYYFNVAKSIYCKSRTKLKKSIAFKSSK